MLSQKEPRSCSTRLTSPKTSSNEIYRNFRLNDRPLVNDNWEMIINQRDELVNQDIDLNAITDIKLFVFYNDFTVY